jgi:hypothetical protein
VWGEVRRGDGREGGDAVRLIFVCLMWLCFILKSGEGRGEGGN